VWRLYSAADVVVQSSRNEGSSNVIIEALGVGGAHRQHGLRVRRSSSARSRSSTS
jgi:glycosyltransferase involved in cell wall biosynthesis